MVEKLFSNIDDKSVVYRSVSSLFAVCTYFIVDDEKVLIVDPGKLSDEVYLWLEQFQNHKKIIYVTHEHFDHHYDVNKLLEFKNTFIYLKSEAFENALSNYKTNLSYYYNTPIKTIRHNYKKRIFGFKITRK
jgi:glyoxylase-like metal-dependent hydrolase (beta-lactamase superfamily II)